MKVFDNSIAENDENTIVFLEDNDDGEVEYRGTPAIDVSSISRDSRVPKAASSRYPYPASFDDMEEDAAIHEVFLSSFATTRRSRGVAPQKTRAQLDMESQPKG